jgi:GNAT superfamily N-acetyltransferase
MVSGYRIRQLTKEEMSLPIEWARQEGWNPGVHDAEPFFAADPKGYLVGELDGEVIGTVSAVAYNDSFGFLGFYIVKPEFRGHGYGIQLAQACWEYMGTRNMGLDGVFERVEDYKKTGFKLAYRNLRYQGVGEKGETVAGLGDVRSLPFQQLLAYDRQCFPAERKAFLEKWIHQPETISLAHLSDGKLQGYGVIRRAFQGYKIGPLFADSPTIAEDIFRGLSSHAPNEPIFLDTPELNPAAVDLAERYGMSVVFGTARMYSKEEPQIELSKVFGVTSFELG